MGKKIKKSDVEAMICYLESRVIDVRKDEKFKYLTEILSVFEVVSVLNILKNGETRKFLKILNKHSTHLLK